MFRTMNINQLIRIEQINHYPHLRYPTLPPPQKKTHTKKEVKNYLPGILWTYLKSFLRVFEKKWEKKRSGKFALHLYRFTPLEYIFSPPFITTMCNMHDIR